MIILSYAVTLSLPDASYTRLSNRPPSYVVHFPSLVAPCHSLPTPSGVSRGRALSVHPPHSRLRHSWPPAARREPERESDGWAVGQRVTQEQRAQLLDPS